MTQGYSEDDRVPYEPKRTLGSGPIQAEYHELMNALARGIDEILNGPKGEAERKSGFVLLMFPFAAAEKRASGRCNYISNAKRDDIVVLLREQLSYFEGMPESDEGHA